MTQQEYDAHVSRRGAVARAKQPKYRNVKVTVDGITFDSKREAHRWGELRIAEKAGAIRFLRRQFTYAIVIDGVHVCSYVADFVYHEKRDGAWWEVVEDAKGMRTREYQIKKKLMRAVYGIEIREV